jgi:fatty acid desaturase
MIEGLVSAEKIKKLSTPRVYKTFIQLLIEYFVICLYIAVALYFSNFFVTIVVMCLIGARQQALAIIGHDAMHYRMTKNKQLNDIMANVFIFFPIWSSLNDIRQRHLLHHKHTDTEKDPELINKKNNPEFKFPQTKIQFLKNVIKYVLGFHFLQVLFNKHYTLKNKLKYVFRGLTLAKKIDAVQYIPSRSETLLRYFFNACVIGFMWYNDFLLYYIVFWILPQILYGPFVNRIRSIYEHFGVHKTEIEASRNLYTTWFDAIFFGISWNFNLHLDHHLFPSVPSYNLNKLHRELLKNKEYLEKAQITKGGFFGVMKECTT